MNQPRFCYYRLLTSFRKLRLRLNVVKRFCHISVPHTPHSYRLYYYFIYIFQTSLNMNSVTCHFEVKVLNFCFYMFWVLDCCDDFTILLILYFTFIIWVRCHMFSYQFLVSYYYYYFLYFGFVIDVVLSVFLFLHLFHLCVYNFVLGCSFWFFWFHHVCFEA